MGLADRLGWAGLIVALLSIAAFYLWPDKKWIGWLCLGTAIVLALTWLRLEFQAPLLRFARDYPIASTLAVGICSGVLIGLAWFFWMTEATVRGVGQPPKTPPPSPPTIANDKTPHEIPKIPPVRPSVKEQPPQTIIQTGPVFGNIKERAVTLADEIMNDLYMHGWPGYGPPRTNFVVEQFPGSDSAKTSVWIKTRSGYFRWKFRDRVIDIRNEFAQLHLRSQELDEFLDHEKSNDDFEKQMAALPPQDRVATPNIFPPQLEGVARELRVLAEQIK